MHTATDIRPQPRLSLKHLLLWLGYNNIAGSEADKRFLCTFGDHRWTPGEW